MYDQRNMLISYVTSDVLPKTYFSKGL